MEVSHFGRICFFGEGIENDVKFHTECLDFLTNPYFFKDMNSINCLQYLFA